MNEEFETRDMNSQVPPGEPTDAAADTTVDAAVNAPAPRRCGRRLLRTALPAVLVLAALAGGTAYIGVTAAGADRSAPATVWRDSGTEPSPDPVENPGKGRTDNDLSRAMLPVPDGYRLGPDSGEFGNDSSLSARQTADLLKNAGVGLPEKERRELDKAITELGVKGVATRSYASDGNDLVAEVTLQRLSDRSAIERWFALQSEFTIGEKGPAVQGHKNATCSLLPSAEEVPLWVVRCAAYVDDLIVIVVAYGREEASTSEVSGLVGKQLDHITSPGVYI